MLGLWSDWAFGKGVYPRIAYSPDGKLLAIADGEGIGLYDAHGVTKVGVLPEYSGAIAFSPDRRVFATGGLNAVHLWDVGQRQPIGVLGWDAQGFNFPVDAVAFSPDGALLASGNGDATVRLWDVEQRQEVAVLRGHQSWSSASSINSRVKVRTFPKGM